MTTELRQNIERQPGEPDYVSFGSIHALQFGLADPSRIMESSPTLTFSIGERVLLSRSEVFSVTHNDGCGWTRAEFLQIVCKTIRDIYIAREAGASAPSELRHNIAEVYLTGATRRDDGVWHLYYLD
jgi:hypothetical protein